MANTFKISYIQCTGSGKADNWTETQTTGSFAPKSLKVNKETIASSTSGRLANGAMYVKYIKSDMRKLEIELPPYPLGDNVYGSVVNNMVGHVCKITYKDPYTGSDRTSKFYVSNAAGEYYSGVISGGIVQGVSFNAIEME